MRKRRRATDDVVATMASLYEDQGVTAAGLQRLYGFDRQTIRNLLVSRGVSIRGRGRGNRSRLVLILAPEIIAGLRRRAGRDRPEALAGRIITVIVRENMINAVLDGD